MNEEWQKCTMLQCLLASYVSLAFFDLESNKKSYEMPPILYMSLCGSINTSAHGLNVAGCCRMRYVAAYLLAALGGNENPEAKDIKKILDSVGIEADDTRLDKVQISLLVIFPGVVAALLPAAGH